MVLGGTPGRQRVLRECEGGLVFLGIREGKSREPLSLEEELTSKVSVVGQEKGIPGRRNSRCQGPEVRSLVQFGN